MAPASTMRAYQLDDPVQGLQLTHVPVPSLRSDEVLITVEAAGLCHTDCHILNGHVDDWIKKRPITLGHEVAGVISDVGTDVSRFRVGDRVVAALPGHSTDEPDFNNAIGMGIDGGYAEHMTVPARFVLPIPPRVSFAQAAVASDSILTAYHAVKCKAAVDASTTVGIVGLGGLGLNGVRIACIQGAVVYGVDIDETKFAEARRQGARDCVTDLSHLQHVRFDVIVDFAGVGSTTADAVSAVRADGRVVLVGLGAPTLELSTLAIVTRRIELRGSLGATMVEFAEVLDLIATGAISPVLEEIPFEMVPEGLKRLERNEVSGRLYTRPNVSSKISSNL
ncbi:alcohol dehydrogenase [Phlyctema vagabunda]|uniref:Alcohol dehydrogenase n=1 Tax=Phlyctema vagabunda TaxID=108571 RepID=A0ABR4PCI2_9HELO